MRIAFLANRDIQSNFALNILTNKLSHHSADGYYEEKKDASSDLKKQIRKLQSGRPQSTKLGMDSYEDFVFCKVIQTLVEECIDQQRLR